MMSDQVDGEAAHVETCVLCGELFDSVESLDAHLSVGRTRCRDPWLAYQPRGWDERPVYLFRPVRNPSPGPLVWSLNTPAKVAG